MTEVKLLISKIWHNIFLGPTLLATENKDEFKHFSFDVIISCGLAQFGTDHKYVVEQFDLQDDRKATLLEHLDEITDKLVRYLASNKKIYLCCTTAKSRAPAIIIYYLMAHHQYTYDQAYGYVEDIVDELEINPNFVAELRAIET